MDSMKYTYYVHVEVLESKRSLFKKKFTIPFTGNSKPFKIPFDSPIIIRDRLDCTIVTFAQGDIGFLIKLCKTTCTIDDVTFTFNHQCIQIKVKQISPTILL